jgi:hypothetical protein
MYASESMKARHRYMALTIEDVKRNLNEARKI